MVAKRSSESCEKQGTPQKTSWISVAVGIKSVPASQLQTENTPIRDADHVDERHNTKKLRGPEIVLFPKHERKQERRPTVQQHRQLSQHYCYTEDPTPASQGLEHIAS